MRLFLTWLLGVPVLVITMILARALSSEGFAANVAGISVSCPRQQQLHAVTPLVSQQGNRIACHRRTVH